MFILIVCYFCRTKSKMPWCAVSLTSKMYWIKSEIFENWTLITFWVLFWKSSGPRRRLALWQVLPCPQSTSFWIMDWLVGSYQLSETPTVIFLFSITDPKGRGIPATVENIADAVTHARFVGTDQASDGVVLMKILQVKLTKTIKQHLFFYIFVLPGFADIGSASRRNSSD